MLGDYWKRNTGTHLLLILVAVIWGSTWAAGRFLSYGLNEENPATLSPATSAWLRYAFAVSVFFVWSISSRGERSFRFLPPSRESWVFSIWLGLLGTMAYQLLFMHGMSWTAAGDASLIIPMNPVFTVLLAVPMLGQRISARMSVGLLIGISGVVVVVGWSPNSGVELGIEGGLGLQELQTESAVLIEGVIGPGSSLLGRSIKELNFRERYDVIILALHRRGVNLRDKFENVRLAFGDTILVEGSPDKINALSQERDFINLSQLN